MLICEMAAYLKMQGITILEALNALYEEYGYYLAYVQSIELTGADAMEKAAKMMSDMRENVPVSIGGATVTEVRDYLLRVRMRIATGEKYPIPLPKSNVLEFVLGDQGSVIVRPSGTEPKVKIYYTASESSKEESEQLLTAMINQMSK